MASEAVKEVQTRLRKQGLCGEIFVDGWGDEVLCILPTPCEKHPTVAPVSGEPGGVRVVVHPDMVPREHISDGHVVASLTYAHRTYIAAHVERHGRVEVDRETLWQALEDWGGEIQHIKTFATRLGLTLSDGGNDG